jgi:hypothetical protein
MSCFPQIFGCISIQVKNRLCTEREFFNRIGRRRTMAAGETNMGKRPRLARKAPIRRTQRRQVHPQRSRILTWEKFYPGGSGSKPVARKSTVGAAWLTRSPRGPTSWRERHPSSGRATGSRISVCRRSRVAGPARDRDSRPHQARRPPTKTGPANFLHTYCYFSGSFTLVTGTPV